ncbi:MAG: Naphthalene 1,2-dioxygenase system ferredoxin subunit [Planctomycetota bacterium]|jgi:3-phenylpropionate/trans-cinnamate dioxygenase ferredoxin subunit
MLDYQYVCERDELPENTPKTFEVDQRFVVLINLSGEIFCIEDMCTHDGGTLGDGQLDGQCLVCPRHGAKFDVKNGKAMCMPATEDTPSHTVRVDGTKVFVALSDS